jgi:hypothetical protein
VLAVLRTRASEVAGGTVVAGEKLPGCFKDMFSPLPNIAGPCAVLASREPLAAIAASQ